MDAILEGNSRELKKNSKETQGYSRETSYHQQQQQTRSSSFGSSDKWQLEREGGFHF